MLVAKMTDIRMKILKDPGENHQLNNSVFVDYVIDDSGGKYVINESVIWGARHSRATRLHELIVLRSSPAIMFIWLF